LPLHPDCPSNGCTLICIAVAACGSESAGIAAKLVVQGNSGG
jgi:hypothetical protein